MKKYKYLLRRKYWDYALIILGLKIACQPEYLGKWYSEQLELMKKGEL